MLDHVATLEPDARTAVSILALIFTAGVTIVLPTVLGWYYVLWERERRASELTRDMLAAGWDADRIREVLEATFPPTENGRRR